MQRWSFNIQREFPQRVLVSAGYVGNRGTGLGVAEEFNPVPAEYLSRSPVRDQPAISRLTRAVTNPFLNIPQFEGGGLQGRTVQVQQLLKPMPQFTGVTSTANGGFSWYHSMQLRVERRFAKGFSIQGSYTWSKFMEAVDRLNDTDAALHHVIAQQDRPHRVVINGIFELPFGQGRRWLSYGGWRNAIFGRWQVQGIYQGQSGPPLGFANIAFYGDIKDIVLPRGERKVERWFNTDAGFERDSRQAARAEHPHLSAALHRAPRRWLQSLGPFPVQELAREGPRNAATARGGAGRAEPRHVRRAEHRAREHRLRAGHRQHCSRTAAHQHFHPLELVRSNAMTTRRDVLRTLAAPAVLRGAAPPPGRTSFTSSPTITARTC